MWEFHVSKMCDEYFANFSFSNYHKHLSRAFNYVEFQNCVSVYKTEESAALKPKGFSKMVLQKSGIIFL